jgi:hypothetical protein
VLFSESQASIIVRSRRDVNIGAYLVSLALSPELFELSRHIASRHATQKLKVPVEC